MATERIQKILMDRRFRALDRRAQVGVLRKVDPAFGKLPLAAQLGVLDAEDFIPPPTLEDAPPSPAAPPVPTEVPLTQGLFLGGSRPRLGDGAAQGIGANGGVRLGDPGLSGPGQGLRLENQAGDPGVRSAGLGTAGRTAVPVAAVAPRLTGPPTTIEEAQALGTQDAGDMLSVFDRIGQGINRIGQRISASAEADAQLGFGERASQAVDRTIEGTKTAFKGLGSGLSGVTVGAAGGIMRYLGEELASDAPNPLLRALAAFPSKADAEGIAQMGIDATELDARVQKFLQPPPEIQLDPFEHPEVLADPRWWVHVGASGVGSMIPFVATGMATAGVAGAVGGVVARTAPAVVGGITEGLVNGSLAYEEARQRGMEPEAAANQAAKIGAATAATSAVAGKLGVFGKGGGAARRAGVSAAAEGIEEGGQEVVTDLIQGDEIQPGRVFTSAVGGAIAGGGASVVTGRQGLKTTLKTPAPPIEGPPLTDTGPQADIRQKAFRDMSAKLAKRGQDEVAHAAEGFGKGLESSLFTKSERADVRAAIERVKAKHKSGQDKRVRLARPEKPAVPETGERQGFDPLPADLEQLAIKLGLDPESPIAMSDRMALRELKTELDAGSKPRLRDPRREPTQPLTGPEAAEVITAPDAESQAAEERFRPDLVPEDPQVDVPVEKPPVEPRVEHSVEPVEQSKAQDVVGESGRAEQLVSEEARQDPNFAVQSESENESAEIQITGTRGSTPVLEPRQSSRPRAEGDKTTIPVPGETRTYEGRYEVRELEDIFASHSGVTFQETPGYQIKNDRDYSDKRNQERVVQDAGEKWNPAFLINDNPDAVNGPSIIDERGNVLGGNSRIMKLERVYALNPAGVPKYNDLLRKKASGFGIDPSKLAGMKRPVLVRVVPDGSIQDTGAAVTDLNKSGTAALTSAERGAAEAKRVTPEVVDYLGAQIEAQGADATLNDALGARGIQVLDRLVKDGVITAQEKPSLIDQDGGLTAEARARIGKMLTGRVFRDSKQLDRTPKSITAKVERIAAPLARVESNPEWNILADVHDAIDLLEVRREAKSRGFASAEELAKQGGLFGGPSVPKFSKRANAIADSLEKRSAVENVKAFRQYADDEKMSRPGASGLLFGEPPTQAEAFKAAFANTTKEILTYERGAMNIEMATLGIAKTFEEDIRPTAKAAATGLVSAADDILRVFAPTSRGKEGLRTGEVLREHLARVAIRYDRAEHALRKARDLFDRRSQEQNYDFISKIEKGEPQENADLDVIAGQLRELLDGRRQDIQDLGTGKLQEYIENYFPRLWKVRTFKGTDAEQKQMIFAKLFGRRPLEGSKSFLKRRTVPTFGDGLKAGLEPVTDNPVELVLLKVREMDRYHMGVMVLRDLKRRGLAKYVPVEKHGAAGWKKLDDPIGTVFGKPAIDVKENFDKLAMDELNDIAKAFGFKVTRENTLAPDSRKAAGLAYKGNGRIRTRFATPWDVLAHEIGHQLDWKFNLKGRFLRGPKLGETKDERRLRVDINKQMRAVADLRFEGSEPSQSFQREVRKADEKLAALVQAFVYAPEKLKRVAPDVWAEWQGAMKDVPALKRLEKVKPSLVLGSNTHEFSLPGLLIRGHWWVPEQAAVVMNNHLMPGLRTKSGVFRATLGANNVLNMVQLGMSAFHLTNTMIDSVSSKFGLGMWRLAHGQPIKGLRDILEAPFGGMIHQALGHKGLKEWFQPGAPGSEIAGMIDAMAMAGGRARMDPGLRTDMRRNMMRAFHRGNILGGLLRVPSAMIEAASWPIMEFIVPRQKIGVFIDLARATLETLPANSDRDVVRAELQKAWDVVDDRLGEVVYDNLFWNRFAKDMAMVSTRSVGWNHGTLRVMAGGILDVGKTGAQTLRAGAQLATGRAVTNPEISFRGAYLAALPIVTAMIGAIVGKLATGEWPEEMEDYFFPKTGELDDDGRPRRFSLPTYMKDVFHIAHDPIGTVSNKVGPLLDLTMDMLGNKDFYGTEIRSPGEPLVVQAQQMAERVGESLVPFGIREAQRAKDRGMSTKSQVLPFFGLVPAARAATQSPAEELLVERMRARLPIGARTKLQSERAQLRGKLQGRIRAQLRGIPREGETIGEIARKGFSEGLFTPSDVSTAVKGATRGSLEGLARRGTLLDLMDAIEVADPDERKMLLPILVSKLPTLNNKPAKEVSALVPRLKVILGTAAPAQP